MVSYKFLQEVIWPVLTEAGFATPPRRSLQAALAAGLEALPTRRFFQTDGQCCSFAHVLNLLWAPLLEYLELCTHEPGPEWTKQLALHHSALLTEMAGIVPGADEPMDIDMWAEHMRDTLLRLLKVDVPKSLILSVISPVVPFHVAPYTCQRSAPPQIWTVQ